MELSLAYCDLSPACPASCDITHHITNIGTGSPDLDTWTLDCLIGAFVGPLLHHLTLFCAQILSEPKNGRVMIIDSLKKL